MKQELFILRQLVQTFLPNIQDSKTSSEENHPKLKSPSAKPKIPVSKVETQEVPKIPGGNNKTMLLIGDSISNNLNKDIIERAISGEVRTCKAYGAVFDSVGNEAKHSARFPANISRM